MTNGKTKNPLPREAGQPAAPLLQFYIPATSSLLERRPRTLKHGDTFGLFDHYGAVVSGEGSPEGLYHRDTRYLSDFRILINERRPLLLSSTVQDNNAVLRVDLTNPDYIVGDWLVLPKDTIHITWSKFIWNATCHERLGIRNFGQVLHQIAFDFHFDADFADIFEVRGHARDRRGSTAIEVSDAAVAFTYRGLDEVVRRLVIRFEPVPARVDAHRATYRLQIAPGAQTSLFVTSSCEEGAPDGRPAERFFPCLRKARRVLRASTRRAAAVESSNQIFNEVLCRAMADLYMLLTETPCGTIPYAGVPWFSTAFGRDAIVTAIELLWIDPTVAKGVLEFLAATQATQHRPEAEAEPGKILHENRAGEMARLGEVPFACYYGSVDSTPLFVVLAGLYFRRTGDADTLSRLWPHIDAALAWIDRYGDHDGDGFVEYRRLGRTGLVNQGWKDSFDAVFHADGSLAEGSIALCEVQGYVYLAKRLAARVAAALGRSDRVETLQREAELLRTRFEAAFWCEDISTYALALDGDKRPCRVRSSNAGHLLLSGIVSAERARLLADQLMDHTFFSGWGVRTIAAGEACYNPMSYHNGSIWPHDNALIGAGLARYGFKRHLLRLFSGIFDAAAYMDLRRLPELFCGFRRNPGTGPTLYPVACSPQAWSCVAPFALLQACLGLDLDAATQRVRFRQPRLPPFLNEVTIRSLAAGGGHLDILLRRYGSDVSVNILRQTGDARVTVTL